MNLTDVDDKTLRGAIEKNISLDAFTEPFKKAFFEDIKTLHILPADEYPEAVAYIPEMIKIIQKLLEKKYAYEHEGNVYFSIKAFPSYGRLSHLHLEELQTTERVASDEYEKQNISDFVLWKAFDKERDGNIFWESPFGKGRPGWHIECSAMSISLLGETIDLHCGGVDNIFPHHENEIAQSEGFTGKTFVKHWAHSEHLIVDGKKMSKSLKNFYTLRDLLKKGYAPDAIRYALLQTHYRMQLNFSLSSLDSAKASLDRIRDFLCRLVSLKEKKQGKTSIEELLVKSESSFDEALSDDLNLSLALSVLFELIREGNTLLDEKKLSEKEALKIFAFFQKADEVLGCIFMRPLEERVPPMVEKALLDREKARKEKDWEKADELRDFILSCGFTIEDSQEGPRVKRISASCEK